MKTLFTVLTIAMAVQFGAQASNNNPQQTIEAQATAQTRDMEKVLNFNEYEYIQLKKLNKQRLVDLSAAKTELTNDASALSGRVAQIEKNYDQAVLKVLHTTVHAAYAQLRQVTTPVEASNGVL